MIEIRKRAAPGPSTQEFGTLYVSAVDNLLHFVDDQGNDNPLISQTTALPSIQHMGGRLALTDGTPSVHGAEYADQATIYYLSHAGDGSNIVHLWDGSNWVPKTFSTMSQHSDVETTFTMTNGSSTVTVPDTSILSVGMSVWVETYLEGGYVLEIISPTQMIVTQAAAGTASATGWVYLEEETVHEIYLYLDDSGEVKFFFKEWADLLGYSARGYDVVGFDGIQCYNSRKYRSIGLVYVEEYDSIQSKTYKRHLVNLYNQVPLGALKQDSSTTTGTGPLSCQLYRLDDNNCIEIMTYGGWYEISVWASLRATGSSGEYRIGFGVNTYSSHTHYLGHYDTNWGQFSASKPIWLNPGLNKIYITQQCGSGNGWTSNGAMVSTMIMG